MLRYLLEKVIASEAKEINEYVVGVEVFDRPSSFDPRTESIVRAQASKPRAKLADYYYSAEGRHDSVTVDLPRGS